MKKKFSIIALFLVWTNYSTAQTVVEIKGNQFYINGKPTYEGCSWNGNKIEGLLMNSRMVQGVFDDLNPKTRDTFAYPDTQKWDAERNNKEFVSAMPVWKSYGLNSFSLNMQGGSPFGYGNFDFLNPGFKSDGALDRNYMKRLDRILKKADELGMVVILGLFYFGQDQNLKDEEAVINATKNMLDWLFKKEFKNVIIEINNETSGKINEYNHQILLHQRVHELINYVKNTQKKGYRYLVGTSFPARIIPTKNVVDASDYVMFHGNAKRKTEDFRTLIENVKIVVGNRNMPIVINEDDNFDFLNPSSHFNIALENYISWGFFDYRKKGVTDQREGFQTIPIDWGINSETKKAFFNKLKEITIGN